MWVIDYGITRNMIRAPTSVTSRFHRVDDRRKNRRGERLWSPAVHTYYVFEQYRGASCVRLGIKLQRGGGGGINAKNRL